MTVTASPPVITLPGHAVVGRVHASGTLTLLSPAHFGGGPGDTTDAAVLRDAAGRPFIPGASLAGACRAFLRRLNVDAEELELLFGGREVKERGGDDLGILSSLIVDDAPLLKSSAPVLVVRDRVRIDPVRGTADDQGKFDYEVLEPGACFRLGLELVLRQAHGARHDRLRLLLNALLDAFGNSQIRLGAHTRRGLGRAEVETWQVTDLDFRRRADVLRWLRDDSPDDDALQRCGGARPGDAISSLGTAPSFTITADLALAGPLLVRATPPGSALHAPDAVQFRSGGAPVVPATSLAGALRHRALRICCTLAGDQHTMRAEELVAELFGPLLHRGGPGAETAGPRPRASRLRVEETVVRHSVAQRQTRIAIDRFTGGAYKTALIEELPEWPRDEAPATLQVALRLEGPRGNGNLGPPSAERGLLLLLLKDLCTGDLPVGGGAAVGRGLLRGVHVAIDQREADGSRRCWQWNEQGGRLEAQEGDLQELEPWVKSLAAQLRGGGGGSSH